MSHADRKHARYSASNAHRWMRCAAQVALASSAPPRPDSEASKEGTKAHEILHQSFTRPWAWRNGADPEMVAAVETVHDFLEGLYVSRGKHLTLLIEQRFIFPQSVVDPDDCAGIADLIVLDDQEREAWSVEFKYGSGIVVEPEQNPQLLFNATGALWNRPIKKLHLVVIQPRIPHHPKGVVRQWSCGPLELVEFQAAVEKAITRAESVRLNSDEPWVWASTGSWCRFCAAEHICPLREREALTVVASPPPRPAELRDVKLPNPADLGLDRIAHILHHADALRSWLAAIENRAVELIEQGVQVPGWKLVAAQARRRWVEGKTAAEIAAELAEISGLPPSEFLRSDPIPITEAERKLVAAARDRAEMGQKDKAAAAARERMAFLTEKRTSGNLTLVPETDARPAANRALLAFEGVNIPSLPPQQEK